MLILIIPRTLLRELEIHTLARQPSVHFRVSIEPVVNTSPLLLIQHHLQDLAPILLRSNSLADNLNRVDQVAKDGIVNGGESARTRAFLSLRSARAVGALGAGENAAGSNHKDVAVRKLLFEFAGKAVKRYVSRRKWVVVQRSDRKIEYLPLLDLMEPLK